MTSKYRLLVSAGDASGDLILAKVIAELKRLYGKDRFEFRGLCGEASREEGVIPVASTKDLAVVGIVEVLRNIKSIYSSLEVLKAQLSKSDSLLCVDFPDFNLRLASMAKKVRVPVDYIVAPQVWAWRAGRLPQIRERVRRLYPALPFEESLFREAGVDAHYLGHPLRDLLPPRNRRDSRTKLGVGENEFLFCIMPGSRKSEIRRHLSLLVRSWLEFRRLKDKLSERHQNVRAVVPLAPGWSAADVKSYAGTVLVELQKLLDSGEWFFSDSSRPAMMASDFGWITSGTATLEAAYYQLPHILLYKLNALTVFMLTQLSSYFSHRDAYAGLPNILLQKAAIPELLQHNFNHRRLAIETVELLANPSLLSSIKKDLRWIPKKLGEAGATSRIATDLGILWKLQS